MANITSQESINHNTKTQQEEGEEVGMQALRLANAVVLPMVLKSALELGVVETICAAGDGVFLSPCEIAQGLPTKPVNPEAPELLDRMLRVLAGYSVLRCRLGSNGRLYAAAPICRFLVKSGDRMSVGPMFLLHHDEVFVESWLHLKDVILRGGSAFNRAHGMSLFEYTRIDQRFNNLFNKAMSGTTTMIMKEVVEVYKGFDALNVLVDVGGGIGSNLSIVTMKYPHVKGINFDLPQVVANAPSYQGVEHVGGDMFVDVPKGDAIFMKRILHDWSDEDCLKILEKCREALPSHGKLIVVEAVLPEKPETDVYSNIVADMDVIMLSQCPGGKERTRKEFEALAADSGFSGCQVICRAYHCWVMEFHK